MSKKIAAGLICLVIVAVGLAVSRGQETRGSAAPRNDAQARDAALAQANAAVKIAEQNVEIQKLQNDCDVSAAESRCELARLDLTKYMEGDMIHEKNLLKSEVQLAGVELATAQDQYDVAQKAAQKVSTGEKDAEIARVVREKARIQTDLATEKLTLLEKFRSPRRIAELQFQLKQCERELKLARLKAEAALVRATAELAAARWNLNLVSAAAGHQTQEQRVK